MDNHLGNRLQPLVERLRVEQKLKSNSPAQWRPRIGHFHWPKFAREILRHQLLERRGFSEEIFVVIKKTAKKKINVDENNIRLRLIILYFFILFPEISGNE